MIRIKNLSKTYKNGTKALDSACFSVKQGEIVGFLGPNGAGKSTALKMITGILSIEEGEVLICGKDIVKNPIVAKKQFSFVPDHPEIFDSIRGIDYLNFIADIYEVSSSEREQRINNLSDRFQLTDSLTKLVSGYSHGMRQKLLIIAALITEPKVFILDEPHVGLDPLSMRTLKDLMKEHCEKGGSVLFSSHVLDVVENVVDRLVIINKGKVMFEGTLEDLKGDRTDSLENIFLEMTK